VTRPLGDRERVGPGAGVAQGVGVGARDRVGPTASGPPTVGDRSAARDLQVGVGRGDDVGHGTARSGDGELVAKGATRVRHGLGLAEGRDLGDRPRTPT